MSGKGQLKFRHMVIDPHTIGTGNSLCLVADVDGDGFNDVIVGNCVDPRKKDRETRRSRSSSAVPSFRRSFLYHRRNSTHRRRLHRLLTGIEIPWRIWHGRLENKGVDVAVIDKNGVCRCI